MFHFRLLYVAVCFLMQSTKFPFQLTYIGNVSIIANVTFTAFLLFSIVANIYNPLSVNTAGKTRLLDDIFAVGFFDRKNIISSRVNRNM